jgi:hypothetical protein
MIGYQYEAIARAHQDELLREARNLRLARSASHDGHSRGEHRLVTVVLALLLGTALFLI